MFKKLIEKIKSISDNWWLAVGFSLILIGALAFAVVVSRYYGDAERNCLMNGYEDYKLTNKGELFCIHRSQASNVVVPWEKIKEANK